MLWAIVGGLVFYLFIGMRSVRLSNLPVWLTTLAIVGLLTWGTTSKVVVGSDAATTGFFQSASDQKAKKLSNATAEEQRQQIQNDYQSICEAMDSPLCTTNMALNGTAMVLALAFFFIGSLACKRFTTHATAVPF